MNERPVLMGKLYPYKEDTQSITFCVTEDCNLRCKYCYMIHKNNFNCMSFDVAKDAVDFILNQNQKPKYSSVVWDFIGGEPTLEMSLIDKITDYIKIRLYETNHAWLYNSFFHIGTNGISYRTREVQDYIKKNRGIVDISITIDGTKEKHDLQRVKMDGSGSFDEVLNSVILWKEQFPKNSTKVTFSSADLPYLKDSICYLWNLGLNIIPANIVFEDVWEKGDVECFEQQLFELSDYIIDNELFYDYSVRFFDPNVGYQLSKKDKESNFCGSGKMITVDSKGNFYPCVRFLDFCTSDSKGLKSGNIYNGFDKSVLEDFDSLTINNVNNEECNNCSIASGCFACAGNNYSCSGTIHKRTTYHCEMQKANVRANKYFWRRYSEKTGNVSELQKNRYNTFFHNGWQLDGLKFLYILTQDNILPHGDFIPNGNNKMDKLTFQKVMDYTYENNIVPVILGKTDYMTNLMNNEVNIKFIDGSELFSISSEVETAIGIFKCNSNIVSPQKVNILQIEKKDITNFKQYAIDLLKHTLRLNISIYNSLLWDDNDMESFKNELENLKKYNRSHFSREINVISNSNDGMGIDSFMVAPNGKVYIRPSDYYINRENYLSSINDFDIFNANYIHTYTSV